MVDRITSFKVVKRAGVSQSAVSRFYMPEQLKSLVLSLVIFQRFVGSGHYLMKLPFGNKFALRVGPKISKMSIQNWRYINEAK